MGEERESTREFLEWLLEGTTGDAYVCSVSNKKGDGPGERHAASRDVGRILRFVERWDQPRRALYYSVGTIRAGGPRNKQGVEANGFIGADVDPSPGEDPAAVADRLSRLPLPPTRIHLTGRGVHGLWRLDAPTADRDRFDALARRLKAMVGGDPAFEPHCASLMRLPGSHNTKDGAWTEVTVLKAGGERYALGELEEWLGTSASNPYLEAAELLQFKPPMDVVAALDAMDHGNVHDTQLRAIASLLSGGVTEDEAVEVVMTATRRVGGEDWDWEREERDLRRMSEDWRRKRARDEGANIVSISTRKRVNAPPVEEPSASEDDEEPLKKKKKPRDKGVHVVAARGVVNAVRQRGDDFMFIGGVLWRCESGVWSMPDPLAAKTWLDNEIEVGLRELKIPSTTRIVNESRAWLCRDPDLAVKSVDWDAHGGVPTKSGLLDPDALTVRPVLSSDYATYRIESNYDVGADCPRWRQLLRDTFAGDDATIGVIQESMGAALIENKPRSMMRAIVLVGPSNCGKSTILKVISDFLSDVVNATTFDDLENAHGGMPFLRRAPWVLHEAFEPGKWHFSAKVKAILSGDAIQVNPKNSPMISKVFKSPVFWGANSAPQFKEASKAMENRLIIIECHQVFRQDAPEGVALEARRAGYDGPAQMILATERAGVLNWALEGWRRLRERGYYESTAEMARAAADMRSDANIAVGFVEECVGFDPGAMVSKPDLYASFVGWWRENKGEGGKCPGPESLGRAIHHLYDARIAVDKSLNSGTGLRFYAGVALNDAGIDLWSGTVNEMSAKGVSGRVSDDANSVNREIPRAWLARPVIEKMQTAHERSKP